ncbi:hypothetical protein [Clavibacter michiganensis]|nr:hypothetical protein [Clavibacter michiganensis]
MPSEDAPAAVDTMSAAERNEELVIDVNDVYCAARSAARRAVA